MIHARRRVGMGLALVLTLASCTTDSTTPTGFVAVSAGADARGIVVNIGTGGSGRIKVGESLQLTATMTNPAGHEVPSNRPVEWAIEGFSGKKPAAALSADGLLTGLEPGTILVSATINQGTALVKIEVVKGEQCDPRDPRSCPPPCDPKKCPPPPPPPCELDCKAPPPQPPLQ